jgi:flagellar operon protein
MSLIDNLHGISPLLPTQTDVGGVQNGVGPGGDDFSSQLDVLIKGTGKTTDQAPEAPDSEQSKPLEELQFSKHAKARLESRGIALDTTQIDKLNQAVERLAAKGAKESLVLLDEHAFVVGVPRRVVITAMTRNEAMGNIFTQIDSTLVLR